MAGICIKRTFTNRNTIELCSQVSVDGAEPSWKSSWDEYLANSRLSCDHVSNGASLSPQSGQDVPSRTNLNCAKRLPIPREPGGPREAMMEVLGALKGICCPIILCEGSAGIWGT